MNKLAVLVFVLIALVQGHPGFAGFNDDILKALAAGDWEQAQKLISSGLNQDDAWTLPISNIKDLKPIPGGHVYGESEFTFHDVSNIDGQKTEQSGGHKVVNNDGKISEYDFKPQIENK